METPLFLADFTVLKPNLTFLFISSIVFFMLISGVLALIHLLVSKEQRSIKDVFWLIALVFTFGFASLFYWWMIKTTKE